MGALCPSSPTALADDQTLDSELKYVAVRRSVPDDHSCLFWAVAYLAESECDRGKARELREVCAQDALKDPNPATRALLLGFESVDAYATWIRDGLNWGGENEILALARHYSFEVAVVCCQSLRVLCYGSDLPGCKSRVYLLYTGQHYDPIVAGRSANVPVDQEQRGQAKADPSLDASALELARQHNVEAAKKAKQRRVKQLKCGGCGALLGDSEAFAAHCAEVEHGDDFAYECEELEVVIEGDEALPEGTLDLTDLNAVHAFTNTGQDPLCNAFPQPVTVGSISYPTLEHYWQAAPFLGSGEEVAKRIAAARSVDEAVMMAGGEGDLQRREDWRERRRELLLEGLLAKASAESSFGPFSQALLATGEKTLVCLHPDPWAGMQAPGGIPTGQNNVGQVLMEVRQRLRATSMA
ncbi:unnamed protein product [Polarella glacialis]|uniref:Ubiquitin thioesterase OTU n=1 Tax=Polarella glacialis TaxID=89957 RepID=A0A813JKQ6_POLGL|nr:unnamed protein product [Polarella glacialis]